MLKLSAIGISEEILNWVELWLENRKQRVTVDKSCSNWSRVRSGVPQGSVLGPLLFLIYINDIDERLLNKLLKFADDTKLLGSASNQTEVNRFQDDINKLAEWSIKWQMPFNAGKCKIMHFGHNNRKVIYSLQNTALQEVQEEKDIGVIVTADFKVKAQCVKASKTGNMMLGMIKRTMVARNKKQLVKLYKSLVRPHLDYAIQAWRPRLHKDMEVLDKVQERFTRMIEDCQKLNYHERLRRIGLTTLSTIFISRFD